MLHIIAIVEDSSAEAETLCAYFTRFAAETGETFQVKRFTTGQEFLTAYQPIYDIVLMDISLPGMNGMQAAKALRKLDRNAVLIFVTSMARYATEGYAVDALDFIVKPVSYATFSMKLRRALLKCAGSQDREYVIHLSDGIYRTSVSRIKYVEVTNHSLVYHTTDGDLNAYGNLRDVEAKLEGCNFIRCNRCYLVNMAFVRAVRGNLLIVDGDELQISRPKRAAVMEALNNYLGG